MRPSPRLLSGGSEPLDTKHGQFLGGWGNLGSQTQKGITTYSISANRQAPLAGTLHAAIFNTWRRFKAQALYVIPPFAIAYATMNWAIEKQEWDALVKRAETMEWQKKNGLANYYGVDRNEYYNSKEARMHDAEMAAEATPGGPVRG
ncbi:hypothetical protein MMC26_004986 [Xylographa opegraphella]|nr:hypothetical protein [Xylographa opegraphella]